MFKPQFCHVYLARLRILGSTSPCWLSFLLGLLLVYWIAGLNHCQAFDYTVVAFFIYTVSKKDSLLLKVLPEL